MLQLSSEQLRRPAEETVRLIARHHLDDAAEALGGLADPNEPEALHDFRVALRRLRSLERAYRPWLAGSFPKRLRRRIRELAHATGTGRDAEVQLAWLDSIAAGLSERDAAGLEYLRERTRPKIDTSYARIVGTAGAAFPGVRRELSTRLSSYDVTVSLDGPRAHATILAVSATPLEEGTKHLSERLRRVESAGDAQTLHAARIAGKRLRYLVEPLQAAHDRLPDMVSRLKSLQDLLGSLHDLQMMASLLAEALESAAAERARRLHAATLSVAPQPTDEESPDPTPGILSMTAALRTQRERLVRELEATWLNGAADPFLRDLLEVSRTFRAHRADGPVIERRYRLSTLPERLAGMEPVVVTQGWLPGRTIRERVRRVRAGVRERYFRTLELGSGAGHTVVEEPISRATWRGLWPLTRRLRLRRRRWETA
jgi:CHAD domain-containing protein